MCGCEAFETKSCELQLVFQLTDKGKYEESRDSIWMGQPKPRHLPVEARVSPSRAKMFRCLSTQPFWRRALSSNAGCRRTKESSDAA
jgi:hypothetical protein